MVLDKHWGIVLGIALGILKGIEMHRFPRA